ncbi:MAG: 1-deoxy-D-xylulose-5-phosphate reductoisomerase [Elusimicrobiota bacterium]|jgi:1-deoxy-D-xylulose-5-phosphate reductoisomerase|nr:1-deoxy-D-xylulose-5-phosphate reductoisomerase [Elusimicrobiota bacterium]
MKNIAVLGSSGSIGIQSLDIISKIKNLSIAALSVNKDIALLKKQIKIFKPKAVCVCSAADKEELKKWLSSQKLRIVVYDGAEGLKKIVTLSEIDMVLFAIVGSAALIPIISAINAGKDIALANKEALVTAGKEIMSLAAKKKVKVLPVDSEHSAIFQCLNGENKKQVKRLILTASGGALYKYKKDFSKITVEQALAHPTWKMGKKITIDSATLMNKGLEAIEASVLFNVAIDKIKIVIHPQSIAHSMVEYIDGSVIAQMSNPDMRLPIQYALTYPDRVEANIKPLNLCGISKLEFYEPDFKKFPCLSLAFEAAKIGQTMPAVLNAANETAVNAFLNKKIKFSDIAKIVEKTMRKHKIIKNCDIDDLIAADIWARNYAREIL